MSGQTRGRPALTAVALAALVLLSGCSVPGLGGDGPSDEDPTLESADANASAVRADALAAMAAVESYRVNGSVERAFGSPRGPNDPDALVDPRVVRTNTTVVVNRTALELRAESVQRTEGQTVEVRTWVVNGTLYANSPAFQGDPGRFQDDYGSEWVVRRPANLSARWATLDPITRQRALLSAANLTLAGVGPENGTYVLRGTVPPAVYEAQTSGLAGRFAAEEFSVTGVEVTYYVDRETGRPVRFRGEVGLTVPTERGTVAVQQTVSLSYSGYDTPVEVTAPSDAPAPEDG